MDERPTHIMTGEIILENFISSKSSKKVDLGDLTDLFSDGLPKVAKEEVPQERTRGVKNINPKNLSSLSSADIKNHDWETVKTPTRTSDIMDGKAIRPSRSDGETIHGGGKDPIVNALNTIFDPNKMANTGNSEFTDHAIGAGKKKRREAEARTEKNRDWEVESKAKTTDDVPANQMGFTPHKTSFEPAPLPEVETPKAIIKEKENMIASAKAGEQAAKMKTEMDNIFQAKWDKDFKDERPWQDRVGETIQDNFNKPQPDAVSDPQKIKFADEFLPTSSKKSEQDLSGIFKVPEDPSKIKEEASIQRDSSRLSIPRTKREDDRSWEKI